MLPSSPEFITILSTWQDFSRLCQNIYSYKSTRPRAPFRGSVAEHSDQQDACAYLPSGSVLACAAFCLPLRPMVASVLRSLLVALLGVLELL